MIAPLTIKPPARQPSSWQELFLSILPDIKQHAEFAIKRWRPEAKEDAVQEVIANAAVAFARLVELGKVDLAYPQVLARFAIAQFHDWRRVGSRNRINEVLSFHAQRNRNFVVERISRFDKETGMWIDAVVEDSRTPVPDQVAFRIDFPEWLSTQSPRTRKIAEELALGRTVGEVVRRFHVSSGRISQSGRDLHDSWREFQGEAETA